MEETFHSSQGTLIYIDPGFMETGHYVNLAAIISSECHRRGVTFGHYAGNNASRDVVKKYGIIPTFSHRAWEALKYREAISPTDDRYDNIATGVLGKVLTYIQRDKRRSLAIPNSQWFSFNRLTNLLVKISRYLDVRLARYTPMRYAACWLEAILLPTKATLLISFKEEMRQILEKIAQELGPDNRVTILMYTGHPVNCIALCQLLSEGEYSQLDIAVHLYLFYLSREFLLGIRSIEYLNLLQEMSDSLEKEDPKGNISIYMDSERSIKKYQPYLTRRIKLGRIALFESNRQNSMVHHPTNHITIGYFGYVTHKHGFPLIVKAFEYLLTKQNSDDVAFVSKVGDDIFDADLLSIYHSFLKEDRIRHYNMFLDRETYYQLISECDIVITPYMMEDYLVQTSGIIVDSITMRKITIVPQNTWMSDIMTEWGVGESFVSGNVGSLVAAIEEVLDNLPQYLTKSTNIDVEGFQKAYSASTFLDMLFSDSQTIAGNNAEILSGRQILPKNDRLGSTK